MEVSNRLDALSPPRVHQGCRGLDLCTCRMSRKRPEAKPGQHFSINGINIPMNIYSVNPSSEPGEARMRGTQGRNAHGRHGGCREPTARAGSLPCAR